VCGDGDVNYTKPARKATYEPALEPRASTQTVKNIIHSTVPLNIQSLVVNNLHS